MIMKYDHWWCGLEHPKPLDVFWGSLTVNLNRLMALKSVDSESPKATRSFRYGKAARLPTFRNAIFCFLVSWYTSNRIWLLHRDIKYWVRYVFTVFMCNWGCWLEGGFGLSLRIPNRADSDGIQYDVSQSVARDFPKTEEFECYCNLYIELISKHSRVTTPPNYKWFPLHSTYCMLSQYRFFQLAGPLHSLLVHPSLRRLQSTSYRCPP